MKKIKIQNAEASAERSVFKSKKSCAPTEVSLQFIDDVKNIVSSGLQAAYGAVNFAMIETYWNVGKRIVTEEQYGNNRAQYGKQLLTKLSEELTLTFGSGYTPRYLRAFRQFYLVIPSFEIWKSRFPNLSWTHIFRTLKIGNETIIRWYLIWNPRF